MNKSTSRGMLLIGIFFLTLVGLSLACDTNRIDPNDPRLQPPVSTIGLTYDDFLKKLNAVPFGGLMAPWITKPAQDTFQAEPVINVSGWAAYFPDSQVVVYEVEPNVDLTAVSSAKSKLATATVASQDDMSWQAAVTLPASRQYLAARVELSNGTFSPFSNIVYVSRGVPAPLVITSPANESVLTTTNVTLTGTGEPKVGLVLSLNGEVTPHTTVIADNGSWTIMDIPLAIAGFDAKKPTTDLNRNVLTVKAEATNQSAEIAVRRIELVRLIWPYRKTEGTTTVWDPAQAKVTAFAYNDWHRYINISTHKALDISTGLSTKLYAVADGTVVATGTSTDGNYLIVDAGGWGYLYLHILENADQLTKTYQVKPGTKVSAGQAIATEGGSGGFPVHLHIEARIWLPGADRSSYKAWWKQTPINLNPPSSYKDYFSKKGINLYSWWGGDDYCLPGGCWMDVNWESVKLGTVPGTSYELGCWTKDGKWSVGSFSPYSTRAYYCLQNPQNCPCK